MIKQSRNDQSRRSLAIATTFASVMIGIAPITAHADVTSVKGSAYGYFSSVGLFGGPPSNSGPTPAVTLPLAGGGPITATAPSASATVGPATLFSSDALSVTTQGTIGPSGSVTTSTSIQNVNKSGVEQVTAATVASTCSASGSGVSASTTFTSGTLQTDSGDDTAGNVHAPVTVPIPANPAPNTTIFGHIHVNGSVENFKVVFNEQIVNADGSITVMAFHEYYLGPTAVGDLIVGQSICGVTPPGSLVTLDIDGSASATKYDARTDGLLAIRYMFGLTGPSLTAGALGGTASRNATDIKTYLDANRSAFDIDGDGNVDALTDGLLIVRYLLGLRGAALVQGAFVPGHRDPAAIEAYLGTLTPTP